MVQTLEKIEVEKLDERVKIAEVLWEQNCNLKCDKIMGAVQCNLDLVW